MNLLKNLRQMMYPAEFRIAAPTWPPDLVTVLHQLAEELSRPIMPEAISEDTAHEKARARLLADMGTGLWRAKVRMVEPGTDRPLEEMRRPYRHIQSVWDALSDAGVQILDHTGEDFHSGRALKVISFQPTPKIEREMIIETIKPTVYVNGEQIQMGEVIVATPEKPQDGKSKGERDG